MNSNKKPGILLVNLGTPDNPEPEAVGRYLSEFLMDPFVIDIPWILRTALVKGLIVPRRKHTSSEAYKTIWTERGGPLLFHLQDVVKAMRVEFAKREAWPVEGAMRYGSPSIRQGLQTLKKSGVDTLVVLPLYPQYAESSTRSSIEKVYAELESMHWSPDIKTISSFYNHPAHIRSWVEVIREQLTPDSHLLLSYHGLPERHLKRIDGQHCLDGGEPKAKESASRQYLCCERASVAACSAKDLCYRAHAVATTRAIVEDLQLPPERWSMSFQSRLGRTPWIKPYTDDVIPLLAKRGVQSLVVATPSFVSDCLETIEEIGDRAKALFLTSGGREFSRVECLNSRPTWIAALCEISRARISS